MQLSVPDTYCLSRYCCALFNQVCHGWLYVTFSLICLPADGIVHSSASWSARRRVDITCCLQLWCSRCTVMGSLTMPYMGGHGNTTVGRLSSSPYGEAYPPPQRWCVLLFFAMTTSAGHPSSVRRRFAYISRKLMSSVDSAIRNEIEQDGKLLPAKDITFVRSCAC